MKWAAQTLWVVLFAAASARADDSWHVRGQVIDDAGRPVAGAAVAPFWSGNGAGKRADGTPLDLSKAEDVRALWGHLGQMEPRGKNAVKTDRDGSFSIAVYNAYRVVMAMDASRGRGGFVVLEKGKENMPVEIRLGPLVHLRARVEGPGTGKSPFWSLVYANVPADPARPIDSCRLAQCGSFEAMLDLWLPPGPYVFQAYGYTDKDEFEGELLPEKSIVLDARNADVDLGTLSLSRRRLDRDRMTLEARAKAEGTWSDYTQHFGEPAPRWHVADARGVSKSAQPADFRGKWILLDFWGLSCRPCLLKTMPRLMKFYEEHAGQRDQFEIVSICIDIEGELKSMSDLDHALKPIVKHVWGGKTVPFPILLDPSFETWQQYGISGLGTVVLIDPEGRLVKGDETTLAEKLKANVR